MAKKDYNKMSKPTNNSEVTEESKVAVETKTEKPKKVTGVVSNCVKLNVRKEPKLGSEVLKVINANKKVTINEADSTDGWYSVRTSDGIDGYCMKEYIVVKS